MKHEIKISRRLAYHIIGEMERMAYLIECELGDTRTLEKLVDDGGMDKSYYELHELLFKTY